MANRSESPLSAGHPLIVSLAVLAALAAGGCTTLKPGETVHYLVACGGGRTGVPNICYAKAEQLCPGGYRILSQDFGSAGDPQSMRIACRAESTKP